MEQERGKSQRKFIFFIAIFQILAVAFFCVFVRYSEVLDAKFHAGNNATGHDEVMDTQYHMIMDIQVMLFVGFGFLMTFLRRFGYSAVCFTMLITVMCVEYGVIIKGLTTLDETATIKIEWLDLLDGGFAAATVLVSFGVVIGKTTPMQLLGMAIIEVPLFVANNYIGYTLLGAVDIGGSIFIHSFGAYFGLFVSLMDRRRDYESQPASDRSGSDHTSDLFSILGTLMLLIYWPSFNGILAINGEGKHRATFNTYVSLCASTMTTFLFSAFLGNETKMNIVDAQNACLAGGVAVGAIADLMLQPYGAILIGSAAGILSTIGYQFIQGWLQDWLNLHDSCGVNNLHGMPGLLSSFLSALYSGLASEETYGQNLYAYFPAVQPDGSYTTSQQAVSQLYALGITMALSIVGGIVTGYIINNDWLFHRLGDHQLFEDAYFFNLSPFDDGFIEDDSGTASYEMYRNSADSVINLRSKSISDGKHLTPTGSAENPAPPETTTRSVNSPYTIEANGYRRGSQNACCLESVSMGSVPSHFHSPPIGVTISPRQKDVLRQTWFQLRKEMDSVGVVTFLKLFETHPETLTPFLSHVNGPKKDKLDQWYKEKLKIHAIRVMAVVEKTINRLDDGDKAIEMLTSYGKRHHSYGVSQEMLQFMSESFISSFKSNIEQDWNEEIEDAWKKLFEFITDGMGRGYPQKAAMP